MLQVTLLSAGQFPHCSSMVVVVSTERKHNGGRLVSHATPAQNSFSSLCTSWHGLYVSVYLLNPGDCHLICCKSDRILDCLERNEKLHCLKLNQASTRTGRICHCFGHLRKSLVPLEGDSQGRLEQFQSYQQLGCQIMRGRYQLSEHILKI